MAGSQCRSAPAPFLTKTYDLVDDPGSEAVVSWGDGGTTFVVWSHADFSRDLLPKYFKHSNFSSFVRQLNTYGFRKVASDRWEFANDFFRRGNKDLLAEIRRRRSISASRQNTGRPYSPASSDSCEDERSSFSSSPGSSLVRSSINHHNSGESSTLATQLCDISGENKKLRKDNQTLSVELAEAKRKCEELVVFLRDNLCVKPEMINSILMGGEGDLKQAEELSASSMDNIYGRGDEEECLKLFGVLLRKEKEKTKTQKIENADCMEGMETGYEAPWIRSSPSSREDSNKVCN